MKNQKLLLNGDEAVAQAALDAGVALGVGYPGTPSTEILETFGALGGKAEWAPNEKVALEVAIGAAFGKARAITTMKHVGLNVAADPLFTAAYTGVQGALVVIVADDPGMASSQNEQDTRRYAIAAGLPILEPADSQQAYDCLASAIEISEQWSIPVILRLTTRISHSKGIVERRTFKKPARATYKKDSSIRVMIPKNARVAHVALRKKLAQIRDEWAEKNGVRLWNGEKNARNLLVTSGVSTLHSREAAPNAALLQVLMVHPFPAKSVAKFVGKSEARVVEEGDPILWESCALAGIKVRKNPEEFRFGELSVSLVKKLLGIRRSAEEAIIPAGKPPQLCPGCPHRSAFQVLHDMKCIVSGDIGCYTLGVAPPFEAIDTTVCMGASITAGLGLRKVLPEEQAKKVVSVIGDSTFIHSGFTGIAEMVYNPPKTGHVVIILDNSTTAMTGMQEHPATGRNLIHEPAPRIILEDVVRAMGVPHVEVIDHVAENARFSEMLATALASGELWVIFARRPCLIASVKAKAFAAADSGAAEEGAKKPRKACKRNSAAEILPAIKSHDIIIAGLGGQGVIKASDILADAFFRAGADVKKAEVHGMSQRGGSVTTDIRTAKERVLSPMVPDGACDVFITLDETQLEPNRHRLAKTALVITPKDLEGLKYGSPRCAAVALLGVFAAKSGLAADFWHDAIRGAFAEKYHEMNIAAFDAGYGK